AGTGVAFLRRRANSSGAAPAVEHNTTNRAEERRLEAGATLSQGSELESKGHWPQTRSAFQQLGQGGLVRTKFAIPTASLLLVLGGCRTAPPPNVTTVPPEPAPVAAALDPVLQRGIENYRSGKYAEAVTDLRAAADALLTPEQMRTYVSTGRFESLANFETAVIYLTMAYAKLGKDAEAREQIQRLLVAEQIHPTYAALPLTT